MRSCYRYRAYEQHELNGEHSHLTCLIIERQNFSKSWVRWHSGAGRWSKWFPFLFTPVVVGAVVLVVVVVVVVVVA